MANMQQSDPVILPPAARHAIAKVATELKLTPKQFSFASLIVSGLSQAEAYRRVYDTEQYNSGLYVDASVLARNPKVALAVEQGRATLNHLSSERGREWREAIDSVLWDVAHDPEAKAADRVNAVKVAGTQRHVQAFAAVTADDAAKLATDLAELVSAFESELSEAGLKCIDASYTVVNPPQVTDSARVIRLLEPVDLPDWCLPGAD